MPDDGRRWAAQAAYAGLLQAGIDAASPALVARLIAAAGPGDGLSAPGLRRRVVVP